MSKGTKIDCIICKFLKALYGLKQSLRLWYKYLSSFFLEKLSLQQIYTDYNIFITKTGINRPNVSTFVDDIKIMGVKKSGMMTKVKQELVNTFSIVNKGPISFYLGLKVECNYE